MVRIPRMALAGLFLLVAACGAERDLSAPAPLEGAATAASSASTPFAAEVLPEPTPPDPVPTTSATPEATPPPVAGTESLETRFPSAAAAVESASERVGVAVLTPDARTYLGGDGGTFALVSVVKLPVMIAALQRAQLEERPLTTEERRLLRLAIEVSSNSATDVLWRSLGGGTGVAALIEPLGVSGIEYAADGQWGDSRGSALAVAELVALLLDEESALSADARAEALDLLESVVWDQRWGASTGVDLSAGGGATLAIKNGWYPEPAGWLLNSAGAITISDASGEASVHVVVVLTEGARTQTEGVRTIEAIASAINHTIVPPALVVAPEPRTFSPSPPPDAFASEVEPGEADVEETPVPEADAPQPTVALVAFAQSADVLVPANAVLLGSEVAGTQLSLWYEVVAADAEELVAVYAGSMVEFGWLELAGPPSVVLSKGGGGRWVGLSTFPSGTAGSRLVQVTISPFPSTLGAGLGSTVTP